MRGIRFALLPFALCLLTAPPALAQFANPEVALAGAAGAMTCGQFTHLSPRHRDSIVRQLNISAPPQTLAQPLVSSANNGRGRGRHHITVQVPPPQNQLTAGILVAACQAVTASDSLRSAYSRFSSSSRGFGVHRR